MRRGLLLLALALAAIAALWATSTRAGEARLHLDVRVDPTHQQIEQIEQIERLLTDAGFEIELGVPKLGRWQGWLPSHLLDDLRALDGVVAVRKPSYASFAAGSALTEGDEALNAAAARARFNVDGSGVRVAVISDGILGLPEAQRTGEAPKLVAAEAFGAGSLSRGEEGTAMIEIVHDLAPGASISFAAVATDLDHIAAVNHFAQRVDIIVDDVSYPFPADQRSDVSVNTTRALEHPTWPLRLYVTAAGNWAESHWAGQWRPGPDGARLGLSSPGRTHLFNDIIGAARADALFGAGNSFAIKPGDQIRLALFWDDPWGRSTNDYDLYLMSAIGEILAASETRQGIGADSHVPREFLEYRHDSEATDLFIVIQNHNDDADPVRFNLFAFHTGGDQLQLRQRTAEGSILAQSDAEDALTVGAANVGRQFVASYSSRGPTLNGTAKPDLIAVDRVTVSETTGFSPRFSGSSAAAPHVAGIAALLLQAQPALLAADGGSPLLERRLIRGILTSTAQDIPPLGPDLASGAGLVDADAAIYFALSEIVVVDSAADSGPGTLRDALGSGASILLFQDTSSQRMIAIESLLPTAASGLIIDGTGWTLVAVAVDIGLRLGDQTELWGLTVIGAQEAGVLIVGDNSRVTDVTTSRNQVGIRINGSNALIERATVENSEANGIEIMDGASATISASLIESNSGAGVMIHSAAGDVLIGPATEPPRLSPASSLPTPIGPLESPSLQPRSGLSHAISGSVSIDGLPAPAGATVDLYLDRRLAASVIVNDQAGFSATATGPGTELRFAVNGVPLDQRVPLEAGATTAIQLRAVSPDTLIGADRDAEHLGRANRIRNNLIGVEISPVEPSQAGRREVWGNLIQRNRTNIASQRSAPTIDELQWSASGLTLSGSALGASIIHLYAGPPTERRYAASALVNNGRFSFRHVDVDPTASEFSVIAHTADGRATPESAVLNLPPPGSIASVNPESGHIDGAETVRICGDGIATDAESPKVWFGNLSARVIFWSGECVTVRTPASPAGATDIALLLPGSRPIVAKDAFTYRAVRVVRLKQGRNFVTWSGTDTRASAAFESLSDAAFRAYAWDADDQQWQTYSTQVPSRLNTLRSVRQGQPLWIILDTPDIDWRQPAPD